MKKYCVLVLFFSIFFINISFLSADCEDVMNDVNQVKVSKISRITDYDDLLGEGYESDFLIGITIDGLKENIRAEVTNDYNDEVISVRYEDTNEGYFEVSSPFIYKSVKMSVQFYSNDETCTSTDVIKRVEVETDIFNTFYYNKTCRENRDLEVCGPHYNNFGSTTEDFKKMVEEMIIERDKTLTDKIIEFLKTYMWYIIIPVVLISVIFIISIILLKRRMKNDYE